MPSKLHLHPGDCLEVLDTLPADHFDAVVTDPPYHLTSIVKRFGKSGAAPAQHGTDGNFARSSRGFMGKEWDGGDIAFRPETWAKLARVLKPGGHLVAFNHSRTYHRMACAIEDAGFEIRDSLLDLYSSATPWAYFLDSLSPDQVKGLRRALAYADAATLAWVYGTGFPKNHDVAQGIDKLRDDSAAIVQVTRFLKDHADRAGVTRAQVDAALGTSDMGGWFLTDLQHRCALPTLEQWVLLRALIGFPDDMDDEFARLTARKGEHGEAWATAEVLGAHDSPAQAAEWREKYEGQAAGNAGAIKAPNSPEAQAWQGWGSALKPAFEPVVLARKPLSESSVARQVLKTGTGAVNIDAARLPCGRWPANVTHDGTPDVLARFPLEKPGGPSAGRLFYCAKASRDDRRGSGHPTVKPQALMQWLVRLVAPKGGRILDPFGGSGSTAWAAWSEGVDCDLIEREPEYQADIRRGIADLEIQNDPSAPAPDALPDQQSLF